MSNSFTFDGHNCSEFNIICSLGNTYDAPERDVDVIEIPGRNGSLTVDNGRWKNISVVYPCYIRVGFAEQAPLIRAWLHGARGYKKLRDDAHPGEYRMARFIGPLQFAPMYTDREAEAEIRFDCMPQRFLTSGDTAVTMINGGTITNPTGYESTPRIRVSGSGDFTLTVNGKNISFTDNNSGITIDSDICRSYNGSTPKDSGMTGDFPVLVPGDNTISWTGSGITSVQITPRWWTI